MPNIQYSSPADIAKYSQIFQQGGGYAHGGLQQQQQAAQMGGGPGLYGGLWKSASQQAQEALAQATAADRAKGGEGLSNMQRRQFLANYGNQGAGAGGGGGAGGGQVMQQPTAQTMAPTGDAYGQEISKETGLPVGTPGPTQQPGLAPGQPAPQPNQVPGQQPGAPPPQTNMPGPGGQPMPGQGQSPPMQQRAPGGAPAQINYSSPGDVAKYEQMFQQGGGYGHNMQPPSFKQGGQVPYTGAFKLHKDEVVLPNSCPMCGRPQ